MLHINFNIITAHMDYLIGYVIHKLIMHYFNEKYIRKAWLSQTNKVQKSFAKRYLERIS